MGTRWNPLLSTPSYSKCAGKIQAVCYSMNLLLLPKFQPKKNKIVKYTLTEHYQMIEVGWLCKAK